jgi:hypothetical protein
MYIHTSLTAPTPLVCGARHVCGTTAEGAVECYAPHDGPERVPLFPAGRNMTVLCLGHTSNMCGPRRVVRAATTRHQPFDHPARPAARAARRPTGTCGAASPSTTRRSRTCRRYRAAPGLPRATRTLARCGADVTARSAVCVVAGMPETLGQAYCWTPSAPDTALRAPTRDADIVRFSDPCALRADGSALCASSSAGAALPIDGAYSDISCAIVT